MSHELRTPLNTILGFSKLLAETRQRQLPDGDIAEYAKLIHGAAEHLLSVVNDILDISKIQSGKYTLEAGDVDVADILATTVKAFRMMALEGQLDLRADIALDLPAFRGDSAKLRQTFSNIISNALKFTPAEGIVEVSARPSGTGGVIVAVRDSGLGMTADEIRIALAPFGQVDGGRSRWREGTGLGLPIAKAFVELHGGQLEIRSTKGAGTEVVMTFPAPAGLDIASSNSPFGTVSSQL